MKNLMSNYEIHQKLRIINLFFKININKKVKIRYE